MGESIDEYEKCIMFHKGETPGMYGVGFLIKKYLSHNIEEIVGISERVCILNIKLPTSREKTESWSIIQAYAPTETTKKEHKIKIESFYKDLEKATQLAHKNTIVMGDFNGKIGQCNLGEEHLIGKHSYGKRSNNGNKIVEYAMQNKLKILNSMYKSKPTRKWTWETPNGEHKNEIDFIMSNRSRYFENVSVLNQFNFNTDHRMVRASITMHPVKKSRKSINLAQLAPMENTKILQESLQSALSNVVENSNSKRKL